MSCKSMTGFGQAVLDTSELSLKIEIRAVNHRFLEFNIRMPREFFALEEAIRTHLAGQLARGHVDVFLSIDSMKVGKRVVVDWEVLDGFVKAEKAALIRYGLPFVSDVSVHAWLSHEKTVSVETTPVELESIWTQLLAAVDEALAKLIAMRIREGKRIQSDLVLKLDGLEQLAFIMRERDNVSSTMHRDRLQKKIEQLRLEVDPVRLWAEVALAVDRSAIDEEIVRLMSHIDEFRHSLHNDGSIGRRLDFIVQEMYREVNTIGSKSQDLRISKAVVDAKVIVEQLREQAQNIE